MLVKACSVSGAPACGPSPPVPRSHAAQAATVAHMPSAAFTAAKLRAGARGGGKRRVSPNYHGVEAPLHHLTQRPGLKVTCATRRRDAHLVSLGLGVHVAVAGLLGVDQRAVHTDLQKAGGGGRRCRLPLQRSTRKRPLDGPPVWSRRREKGAGAARRGLRHAPDGGPPRGVASGATVGALDKDGHC